MFFSQSCRYLNTDYAFASTVCRNLEAGIRHIVVTYNIVCQWGKEVRQRLEEYKSMKDITLRSLSSLCFVVPKFHLIGHGKSYHLNYNLAFMRGVGITHGKGIETICSHSTSLTLWS